MNTIQLKRGTYNRWISTATVLGSGELGLDTTNNIIKVGNGSGTWGNLPIFNTNISGVFSATTGIFQDIVANGSGDIILSANNDLGFPILSVSRTGVVNVNGVSNFNSVPLVSGVPVSLSGHSHASSDITNFNASVSGLVSGIYAPLSGKLNQFASTSSAELFSIISDDTGSGLLVFNTSPSFSGVPTVPTASSGTNTNQIASTSFVRTEISNLLASAPSTLDTLNELATALGNDANFSTTVTNNLAGKANLSGASFTGTITAPTGNFTTLQQNGVAVSVSGHTHTASQITDFNSSVSGLLPVKNILAGSGIAVSGNLGDYTVSVGIIDCGIIAPTSIFIPPTVAYYAFNANVTDANALYDGTAYGSPSFVSGYVGNAIQLNSPSKYVTVPRSISTNWTIAFFVRTASASPSSSNWYDGVSLLNGEMPGDVNDFGVVYLNNKVSVGIGNPDTTIFSSSTINNNVWRHVCATRNSTTGQVKIYIDGTLETTANMPTGTKSAASTLIIGGSVKYGSFNGLIDNMKIFDSVLTDAQISSLATGN